MSKRAASPPPERPETDSFGALVGAQVGPIAPLAPHGRAELPRPRPRPIPAQLVRDEADALRESLSDHVPYELAMESGEELRFLRTGLSTDVLRKLRRGHWRIDNHLDLHGHTVDEARTALTLFLQECRHTGARCVRIVHGKGLRSKGREPVLKGKVAAWLLQRDEVLAYCQARTVDGGGGAVIVLLKAGTKRRG
ncbi:MAG: Smr/MutS family protein [Burkholderiales bacterium]